MLYVGADLHKKSIGLCVILVENGKPRVLRRQTLAWQTEASRRFFAGLGAFRVAVEATAADEWLFRLIEDLAVKCKLRHKLVHCPWATRSKAAPVRRKVVHSSIARAPTLR